MKASSQSGQADSRSRRAGSQSSQSRQAAVLPCSQSSQSSQAGRRAGSRCRNNRWPATATKDLVERAQTAQLGEKTLGEINTWRDKKR